MLDYNDLEGHESHALVRICRVQGSMNLHGSPIRPNHFMVLEITEGNSYHGLGDIHHHAGKHIVEIAMSETQFAELITTPNSGQGTPCTLVYSRDGALKKYEQPPAMKTEASLTREEFTRKVEAQMASMKSVKRRIDKLLEEGSVTKKRREEISEEINGFLRLFSSSAPFFMERFEENAEKVVAAAKAEITAHADFEARRTGIAAIKAGVEVPMLEAPKEDPS